MFSFLLFLLSRFSSQPARADPRRLKNGCMRAVFAFRPAWQTARQRRDAPAEAAKTPTASIFQMGTVFPPFCASKRRAALRRPAVGRTMPRGYCTVIVADRSPMVMVCSPAVSKTVSGQGRQDGGGFVFLQELWNDARIENQICANPLPGSIRRVRRSYSYNTTIYPEITMENPAQLLAIIRTCKPFLPENAPFRGGSGRPGAKNGGGQAAHRRAARNPEGQGLSRFSVCLSNTCTLPVSTPREMVLPKVVEPPGILTIRMCRAALR